VQENDEIERSSIRSEESFQERTPILIVFERSMAAHTHVNVDLAHKLGVDRPTYRFESAQRQCCSA
jgi:hypothetical protein